MTDENEPRLYQHAGCPGWGRCLLIEERDAKVFLRGEDGGEHVLASSHRGALIPVELTPDEARAVAAAIQAKRPAKSSPARKRSSVAKPRTPPLSFDEQLLRFEAAFPGGFGGELFAAQGRGAKQAAADRARTLLSPESLGDAATGFQAVTSLLGETKIVHPMEGAIPLRALAPEHQVDAAALRELLHGTGDLAPRFDRFVASIRLEAAAGAAAAKRPSWPLVTIFAALYHPGEHLFVKPRLMQAQAATLGLTINYRPLPDGAAYAEFLAVARKLEETLVERGLAPRDLLDVATFVATTLSPNAKGAAAPAADAPSPPTP